MSLIRMSKRSEAIRRRASSPLDATRCPYSSISRTAFRRLQMDLSSSTTRILGLVGDPERKDGTFANLALHENIDAVFNRNFFYKRQTEPKACLVAGFFVATAVKLLENPGALISRNAAPLIANLKAHAATAVRHIKTDDGTRRTIFNCIGHQIG